MCRMIYVLHFVVTPPLLRLHSQSELSFTSWRYVNVILSQNANFFSGSIKANFTLNNTLEMNVMIPYNWMEFK